MPTECGTKLKQRTCGTALPSSRVPAAPAAPSLAPTLRSGWPAARNNSQWPQRVQQCKKGPQRGAKSVGGGRRVRRRAPRGSSVRAAPGGAQAPTVPHMGRRPRTGHMGGESPLTHFAQVKPRQDHAAICTQRPAVHLHVDPPGGFDQTGAVTRAEAQRGTCPPLLLGRLNKYIHRPTYDGTVLVAWRPPRITSESGATPHENPRAPTHWDDKNEHGLLSCTSPSPSPWP